MLSEDADFALHGYKFTRHTVYDTLKLSPTTPMDDKRLLDDLSSVPDVKDWIDNNMSGKYHVKFEAMKVKDFKVHINERKAEGKLRRDNDRDHS